MHYLIASVVDDASTNIKQRLLERASWLTTDQEFQDHKVRKLHGNPFVSGHTDQLLLPPKGTLLVTLQDWHLYAEDLDRELVEAGLPEPELLIFLSRHSAASGKPTLTVHPVGNYQKAQYGGQPGTLSLSAPQWMTGALCELSQQTAYVGLEHGVSYEVTHHGPFLQTPSFFIEIGSDETQWPRKGPANAIALSLLKAEAAQGPVLVGVGGGHYAPRHTDVALEFKASIGHMVPAYALKDQPLEKQTRALELAWQRTPTAQGYYFHRKGLSKPLQRELKAWAEERDRPVLSSKELEPLVK